MRHNLARVRRVPVLEQVDALPCPKGQRAVDDSDVGSTAALRCAGMSSGPSARCRIQPIEGSFACGARRRKNSSRSRCTSGSAFSWITIEQDVCCTNSVSNPAPTLARFANARTSLVNS
jgi:hypothetical protein